MTEETTNLVIELGVKEVEEDAVSEVKDWLQSLEAHGYIEYHELHVDREV